jgi:hypothetical protein
MVSNGASIANVYSSGHVSGTGVSGGLVGELADGTVSRSYSDILASGVPVCVGVGPVGGGCTRLTTTQMLQAANLGALDFTNTWAIEDGQSYPYLRNNPQMPHPLPLEPTGTTTAALSQPANTASASNSQTYSALQGAGLPVPLVPGIPAVQCSSGQTKAANQQLVQCN